MNLRDFLNWAEGQGKLVRVDRAVDPTLEMAGVIHALEGQPLLFGDPQRPGWRVASGICARREHFAWALQVAP